MSAPFVTGLRSRKSTLRLAPEGTPAITIRVEMPEVWDTIRVAVASTELVLSVKVAALETLFPEAEMHQDFVLKLRGWGDTHDEAASLADVGVIDGSILLLTHRRRRAVR